MQVAIAAYPQVFLSFSACSNFISNLCSLTSQSMCFPVKKLFILSLQALVVPIYSTCYIWVVYTHHCLLWYWLCSDKALQDCT